MEKQFGRTSAEIRQVYATLLRVQRLARQIDNDDLLLKSLLDQAENIRRSLTGLSEDDTRLLEAKPGYDQAVEVLRTWTTDIVQVSNAIDDLDEY